MITYKAGINLGGWISQYKESTKEHFEGFIVEKDIRIIADSGFDHVRLPFDYPVIESDDKPGVYIEEGLAHIDKCLAWCRKYGLGLVLDLHHAPGYRFQDLETNTLFEDPAQQQRFVDIWTFMAKRYLSEREHIVFEILNEIVEPDSSRWNALMLKTIKAIRQLDSSRMIYVGGNNYNSPNELKNLAEIDDDYIVYNFHFYNPFFFTHQKAYWSQSAMDYNTNVVYPGSYPGIEAFVNANPEYAYMMALKDQTLNKELLRRDLQGALEFRESHKNCQLYCGEFGVIGLADLPSRERWHEDFMSLLEEYDIGGAVWSYKEMDFELYHNDGEPLSTSLIKTLVR